MTHARRPYRGRAGAVAALLLTCLIGGCNPAWTTPERYDAGLVMILPGVEGAGPLNLRICDGLYAGGVESALVLRDWSGLLGPLGNQQSEARNRQVAGEIAEQIAAYQDEHPGSPVVLIGHSGGSAMAIWTAEALPPGRQVNGIVLLASSLSSGYDLRPALEKSARGIVNFYSREDRILLGLATRAAGTMDRTRSSAAGRTGFMVPELAGMAWAYERLVQVAWTPRLVVLGHLGGHGGYTKIEFIREVLAPLVRQQAWTPEEVERLIDEGVARMQAAASQPASQPATQPASQPATSP